MKINLGLDSNARNEVAGLLSHLLADTYVLYMKTQNFHWNVTGPHFYELHKMFEEHYKELAAAIDTIAERIRALGFSAPGSFAQYLEMTDLREEQGVPNTEEMVQQLLADHEAIAATLRTEISTVAEFEDEVSAGVMAERMAAHEKAAWMLRSLF
jgi:starvation-inducible DNA-binding protein